MSDPWCPATNPVSEPPAVKVRNRSVIKERNKCQMCISNNGDPLNCYFHFRITGTKRIIRHISIKYFKGEFLFGVVINEVEKWTLSRRLAENKMSYLI